MRARIIGILSTEHTEDTEFFLVAYGKKSLGEIFVEMLLTQEMKFP